MTDGSTAAAAGRSPPRDGGYAWYVVAMLTVAYAVAFIDRQVLNLLVDPIKSDLRLTDTQVSLLQGLAFMGAYVAMGPPFGRWADSGNRRNLLVLGIVMWSGFTVLCGLANGFWTLFGARAGVGGAEACLIPAAWSIISDYFSRERLARALSVFLMGPYLGGGLALIFGGMVIGAIGDTGSDLPLLADRSPWQLVFIVVGAPGLLLALLLLTVREPPRLSASGAAVDSRRFALREVAAFLWEGRAFFLRFYIGMAMIIIVLYALPAWMPAFLMRAHGAPAAEVGIEYGVLVLVGGSCGVLLGPLVGRWLTRRGHGDAPVRTAAGAAVGLIPACALLPLAPDYRSALALAGVATLLYSLPQAMAASALQLATPNRMRGVVSSLYVFLVSVTGLGVAPTLIAVCTDYLFRDPAMVGWSIALVCGLAAVIAVGLIASALPHYRAAVARAAEA